MWVVHRHKRSSISMIRLHITLGSGGYFGASFASRGAIFVKAFAIFLVGVALVVYFFVGTCIGDCTDHSDGVLTPSDTSSKLDSISANSRSVARPDEVQNAKKQLYATTQVNAVPSGNPKIDQAIRAARAQLQLGDAATPSNPNIRLDSNGAGLPVGARRGPSPPWTRFQDSVILALWQNHLCL